MDLQQRAFPAQLEQTCLAVTFGVAFSQPFTVPCSPYIFTDYFYHGRQEDAAEFLTRFALDPAASQSLARLFRGEMRVTRQCLDSNCMHMHAPRLETFQGLSLSLLGNVPGAPAFGTVQEALGDYL